MRLTIRSVLGCANFQADFEPGPTYVHGPNSSGKTSIATALAALTAWRGNPLSLPSADRKDYVAMGASEALASLDNGRVEWDGRQIISEEEGAPDSHPHAVGLVDFTRPRQGVADRAACWEQLFLPESPREILEPHWKFPADQLDAIVDQIEKEGWDRALSNAEGHRAAAKRRWGEIAGERHGARKAKTWTPPNWREELGGESEDSLQAAHTEAADARTRLISVRAVSEQEIERARLARDDLLPAATERLRALGAVAQEARADLEEHRANASRARATTQKLLDRFRDLKALVEAEAPHACPACDAELDLAGGKLVEWEAPSGVDVEAARAEMAEVREKGLASKAAFNGLGAKTAALEAAFDKARAAVGEKRGEINLIERQAEGADREAAEGPDQSAIEQLTVRIDEARRDLESWRLKRDADAAAANVAHYDEICKLLGPTGARSSTMRKRMGAVRQVIAGLCKGANWTEVEILQDYSVRSGGVAIRVAADNEKLRAQWLCQMAAAYLKRTEWLVLDRADVLRFSEWDGLMKIVEFMVRALPHLRIVVCATGDGTECPAPWRKINLSVG